MEETVLFNVPKIATDHVDTLMDHVKIVKQVGRVLIAQKVINKDYFENSFCDLFSFFFNPEFLNKSIYSKDRGSVSRNTPFV